MSKTRKFFDNGSSPRVWGTFIIRAPTRRQCGFIPTCVGNILSHRPLNSLQSVHPHVCGEHVLRQSFQLAPGGSSPRVWGTYDLSARLSRPLRFIPTCVGNICIKSMKWSSKTVHPHVCGEHLVSNLTLLCQSGSSPRVWGTFPMTPVVFGINRFIPTCVGNITQ